mgnify:CR=1 FL=1
MKNIITIVLLFFGLNTYSQQMGFNVVYVKAEENSEDQIGEMFENYYTNNKMKSGGAVLERLRHGKPEGMTHRLVWLWELGNRGMVDGELSEFERSSFRRGISNLVDNWGMSYSGRIVNWYPGDVEKTFADIDYSLTKLNFKPKITIQEGIPKFIAWYKSYHNII